MNNWKPKEPEVRPTRSATPQYEEEVDEKTGHKIHLHCGRCGAVWIGWEDEARDGVLRCKYTGGALFYRSEAGYSYAYRCRCTAGRQNFAEPMRDAPDWLWEQERAVDSDKTHGANEPG